MVHRYLLLLLLGVVLVALSDATIGDNVKLPPPPPPPVRLGGKTEPQQPLLSTTIQPPEPIAIIGTKKDETKLPTSLLINNAISSTGNEYATINNYKNLTKNTQVTRMDSKEQQQQPPPPPRTIPMQHNNLLHHSQQPPPPPLQQQKQQLHPPDSKVRQQPPPPPTSTHSIRPIGSVVGQQQYNTIMRQPFPRTPSQPPQQQEQKQPNSPLWKSLWQRVERSLDVLADMEDVVADRATQWLAKPASSLIPHRHNSKPTLPSRPIVGTPKSTISSPTTTIRTSPPTTTSSASTPRTLNKFEIAKQQVKALKENAASEQSLFPKSRSVNWDQLNKVGRRRSTMIHTNGGASQPSSSTYPIEPDMTRRRENMFTTAAAAAATHRNTNHVTSAITTTAVRPSISLDDNDETLWSKLIGRLPTLPTMPLSKFFGKGSSSFQRLSRETMEAWKEEDNVAHRVNKRVRQSTISDNSGVPSSFTPPIDDMLARSANGKSTSLLLSRNTAQCHTIGRSKAIFDIACLGFILLGTHALVPALQSFSLSWSSTTFFSELATALLVSSDTWAYYAFVAAILTAFTNYVVFDGTARALSTQVGQLVRSDTQYCQLYMRLVTSTPVEKSTQERLKAAARSQVLAAIQLARLKSFVDFLIATLVIMTVSILRPMTFALLGGIAEIVALEDWHSHWPLPWSSLFEHVKGIVLPLGKTLTALVVGEIQHVIDHPMKAAFQIATFAALLLVTILPSMEQQRKVARSIDDDEVDEDSAPSLFGSVKTISNLGVSSASRLGLLSKSGALEGTLERWRASIAQPIPSASYSSFSAFFRLFSYTIISGAILIAPIIVSLLAGVPGPSKVLRPTSILQWDSALDVSIVLLFTFGLTWRAIRAAVETSTLKPHVAKFVQNLAEAVDEVTSSNRSGMTKLGTSMSPVKGLCVTDLWTAHTTKRAWSVRGANLECPAGQVLVILGEDGSGKTRLLTAIAEALVFPAKKSLSNTKVRGFVSIGGLDAMKWDRSELKKRLGLFLNDVRTISDNAEFMSGFTLEEILEPMDGLLSSHSPGTRERSAMNIALEITGLSTSLLPRLPSKLSTVVSANEDELAPSPTRPRCNSLSPSEWSKLLLTRVLAQTIYDNDYSSRTGSSENSLVGSLLVLDDVTAYMSELEETRTLAALRRTGAATVLTSHKWATGRFADRIVVIKDGAVVERGSHIELLNRGPQQSLYAQKWYAMTSSY